MAKGIGLIGNFKGKVGNMVGYKLSDSNTGNTQGIRVYQPIVRNPKTSAQAEQRAKLAPINATYRALKMIIDRGNEGLPYGNKSRLAWLKQAFKAENMPWFVKGATINYPVGCALTKGSLAGVQTIVDVDSLEIKVDDVTSSSDVSTIGKVSALILGGYSHLKVGDQLTFVAVGPANGGLNVEINSIILDPTSTQASNLFTAGTNVIGISVVGSSEAGAIIVSREGANGEHLRSTTSLVLASDTEISAPYDATSKAAAIESYQNAAGANSDWAEESIQ